MTTSTSRPRKQIHLGAHFPGVNDTTVWSDPRSASRIEFSSFEHLARHAEAAKLDFLFLAEGLRLREHKGQIYDLDVVGRPDTLPLLAAVAASPLLAAEQFGTIAALHRGRVDLGVGRAWTPPSAPPDDGAPLPGPAPHDPGALRVPAAPPGLGSDPARLERLKAQQRVIGAARSPASLRAELEQILALRSGELVDDTGYTSPAVEGADFELWVLASSGGESARTAAELGLPLAANYYVSPATVLETVAAYRRSFRPGVLDQPYVIVSAATGADELIVTSIAHDPRDALRSFELLAQVWFDVVPVGRDLDRAPAVAFSH